MLCLVKDGEILVFLLLLLVSISFLLFSFTGWLEFQKVIEKEDEKKGWGLILQLVFIFFSIIIYTLFVIV